MWKLPRHAADGQMTWNLVIGTKRMYLRFAFELISPKFEEGVGGVANIGGS